MRFFGLPQLAQKFPKDYAVWEIHPVMKLTVQQ
jgi:hypothetical protein